ncbi:MAG TPA: malonic semialdehyde reductase [Trichormus sp.]
MSSSTNIDSSHAGLQISSEALKQLFSDGRSFSAWLPKPVSEETLRQLYDLVKMGPTSANGCPARFVFLTTQHSKKRIEPALMQKNVEKTLKAPVTVIVAWDTEFYEQFSKLTPGHDWKSFFAGNQPLIDATVFRNSSLQGAYMIIAARALGLDCGPMSGFDNAKVNAEFFPDGKWQSNFLCNIGYGDRTSLTPRNPRLEFADACIIL